ncbi:DUF6081 family protein [Nocardia sp. NPDC004604]|uniref:DUF6081 family protein n=1 Tax=Nocardia sp. NPDC004604 TaxID=3157013 RepID=UPI0033A319D2
MTTSATPGTEVYDDFSGKELDSKRWSFLEFPQPDAEPFVCSDPSALTELLDGGVRIHIERFETSHPVQIMDNCKYVLLSTADFPLPERGQIVFEADIAARNINAAARDYRDGFASFVLVDMTTGFVFDLCTSSDAVFAIDERLPVPQVEQPYTRIIEDPLADVTAGPDRTVHARITIDTATRSVCWEADDATIFQTTVSELPATLKIGLGIFTLHPGTGNASSSLRGQGISAVWRNIRVTTQAD